MSWTNTQKQTAIIACRAAGIDEEGRQLILRQFPHAMCGGRVTSTSPRLSNVDFEQFMAIVERSAGGELPRYTKHYWRAKANDGLDRMRSKAVAIAQQLGARALIAPDGVGLAGWIDRMFPGKTLDELDYHELYVIIEGLKAYARRHDVKEVA